MANATGQKIYRAGLTDEEREELGSIVKGTAAAQKRTRAHILLLADEARKDGPPADDGIASVLGAGTATVERVRKRCVMEGVEAAIGRREQANRMPRKLDGAGEAQLVALACGAPPEGCATWTLKLLGSRLVELEVVDSISPATVGRVLKKTRSSRGNTTTGAFRRNRMQIS